MEKATEGHKGKTDMKLGHECYSVSSQNHTIFRLPKPDPAIYQMGTLRAREVKQLLQGHTASNTQNQEWHTVPWRQIYISPPHRSQISRDQKSTLWNDSWTSLLLYLVQKILATTSKEPSHKPTYKFCPIIKHPFSALLCLGWCYGLNVWAPQIHMLNS